MPRKSPLLLLLLAGSLAASADETPDPELDRVVAGFRQQRVDAKRTAFAAYADQLRHMEADFSAKGDAAAAAKARQEYRAILEKLDAVSGKSASPKGDGESKRPATRQKEDDLDSIFGGKKGDDDPAESTAPRRDGVVMLRIRDAKTYPQGKPDRSFWSAPGATVKWTLQDVPPGSYRVRLVFVGASGESGGKGEVLVGESPVPFTVKPPHDNWTAPAMREVAVLEIQKCPLDFSIRCVGLAEGAKSLFELRRVDLVPEKTPDSPQPAAAADGKMEPQPQREPQPTPPPAKKPEPDKPKKGIDF